MRKLSKVIAVSVIAAVGVAGVVHLRERHAKAKLHEVIAVSGLLREESVSVGELLMGHFYNESSHETDAGVRFWDMFDHLKKGDRFDHFKKIERFRQMASWRMHDADSVPDSLQRTKIVVVRYYRVCTELADLVTKPPETMTFEDFERRRRQLDDEAARLQDEARILTE